MFQNGEYRTQKRIGLAPSHNLKGLKESNTNIWVFIFLHLKSECYSAKVFTIALLHY